jgi:acid phosphatase (class A)
MRIPTVAACAVLFSALSFALYPQSASHPQVAGYLTGSAIPNLTQILPTAPAPDSPRDVADRAIFKSTRALEDSPRWKLAQNDDKLSVAALLADFHCATGVDANAENAPLLTHLLARVSRDAGAATGPAKEYFHRKRPFLVDKGPVCISISPSFEKSFDYPSGHTTLGWAVGMILAEIDPAHATAILTRGRSFGESRVVCGVHNASAVESGRVSGAALVAALNANETFRIDLEKARAELAGLQPEAGHDCAAEESLIAKTPY